MIKVLHIIPGLRVGGAEMMLYKLLSGSSREHFRHDVICLAGRGELGPRIAALGVPVAYMDLPRHGLSASGAVRLMRHARRATPDIIQGWMYHGNLAASFARLTFLQRRVVCAWNIRCTISGLKASTGAVARLLPRLPLQPNVIINNSRRSATSHAEVGYQLKRTVIIPNGFDCERYRPVPDAGVRLRSLLGLRAGTPIVGMVARYDTSKDFGNLIAAAALVHQSLAHAHFVLTGWNVAWTNTELARNIENAGLEKCFHLLGQRDDVPELVAGFDVFCLSSVAEGFPNVIGEAMACGVPSVVTDAGDSAWLLGEAGLVVPVRDPPALSAALCAVLSMTAQQRRELGERARRRVAEHFSLTKAVRQYEALYMELVADPRAQLAGDRVL